MFELDPLVLDHPGAVADEAVEAAGREQLGQVVVDDEEGGVGGQEQFGRGPGRGGCEAGEDRQRGPQLGGGRGGGAWLGEL